ncbi:hypothetical protein FGIG_12497 [Fasciola gigantica]|uniref:Uncharacterized protein n=1 Tax=Fasciola gigantica TaxID=46835 RepID=A0A504Z0C3_FASGI|nr:hypothetical protein FGIG_12497 [Fasciola gigantica]
MPRRSSGDLDDRMLVTFAQDDHMGLDDACEAVDCCLLTISRFLRKPLTGALSADADSLDDRYFSEAQIKQTLSTLRGRLKQLTSSQYAASLCGETPGRSLVNGGSLLGRAARKLVRLMLVVEGEASIVPGGLSSASAPPLDVKTPTRMPSTGTPVTVGHDTHVIRMFESPSAPLSCTPTNRSAEQENNENVDPFSIAVASDEAFSLVSVT